MTPMPPSPFLISPAPSVSSLPSGESEPSVTSAWGAGETFRTPPGYVLVEREVVEQMFAMIQAPNPSWDYLAIGQGAA